MTGSAWDPELAALLDNRAMGRCERCGTRLGSWFSRHHRTPRGMGGANRNFGAADGLVLCGSGTSGCHGWVEQHREESRTYGWLVPAGGGPTENVAVLYQGYWAYLMESGFVDYLSPGEAMRAGLPKVPEVGAGR